MGLRKHNNRKTTLVATPVSEDEATNGHFVYELYNTFTGGTEQQRREVRLSFFVWNINELDIINQRFSVRFNLYASWEEDTQNLFKKKLLEKQEKSFEKEESFKKEMLPWDPQLRFTNLFEEDDTDKEEWYRVFAVNNDVSASYDVSLKPCDIENYEGDKVIVMQCKRIKGIFHEGYEMNDFPFDYQHLHIGVTSRWDHTKVALSFDKEKPTQISSQSFISQTFELKAPRLLSYRNDWDEDSLPLLSKAAESATGARYCRAYLALTVQRKPNFVLWNVMAIMTLVGFLSFATYALPPEDLGDRQAAVFTLVLTTVAFKFVTTTMMPEISHLTLVDVVIYSCMFLQALMMICIYISANLSDAYYFDVASAILLFSGWLATLFWFVWKGFSYSRMRKDYIAQCKKKFEIMTGDEKEKMTYEYGRVSNPPTIEHLRIGCDKRVS